jgi:hypothetical protein
MLDREDVRWLLRWMAACALIVLQGVAPSAQAPDARDHGPALQAFRDNVERYARLRARFEEPLPAFDQRRDPWSLILTRSYLASAIRTARPGAGLGNVFTPPVAPMFRYMVREAIYGTDIEGLVDESLDIDDFVIDVRVNETLPRWSFRTLPGMLQEQLPELPSGIEFRLVGDALVLWDSHAEIVIDALPGALVEE